MVSPEYQEETHEGMVYIYVDPDPNDGQDGEWIDLRHFTCCASWADSPCLTWRQVFEGSVGVEIGQWITGVFVPGIYPDTASSAQVWGHQFNGEPGEDYFSNAQGAVLGEYIEAGGFDTPEQVLEEFIVWIGNLNPVPPGPNIAGWADLPGNQEELVQEYLEHEDYPAETWGEWIIGIITWPISGGNLF